MGGLGGLAPQKLWLLMKAKTNGTHLTPPPHSWWNIWPPLPKGIFIFNPPSTSPKQFRPPLNITAPPPPPPGNKWLVPNRAADQRLCFCYIDTVFPPLPKSWISASSDLLWLYSPVCVGPGRIPPNTGFGRKFVFSWHVFLFFFCTVTTFCLIRNKHLQQNNASLLTTQPYMSRIARNPVFGVYNPARHSTVTTFTVQ